MHPQSRGSGRKEFLPNRGEKEHLRKGGHELRDRKILTTAKTISLKSWRRTSLLTKESKSKRQGAKGPGKGERHHLLVTEKGRLKKKALG